MRSDWDDAPEHLRSPEAPSTSANAAKPLNSTSMSNAVYGEHASTVTAKIIATG